MPLDIKLVKTLMHRQNLSQKDLAGMAGLTEAALSRYLSGERQPRAEKVANLATALGTTSDELLGRAMSPPGPSELVRLVARNADKIPADVKMQLIRILAMPDETTERKD